SWEPEFYFEAMAATKGWRAVAELWRKDVDRSPDSLSQCLRKASVFRYLEDTNAYRQVVTLLVALAPSARNFDDQRMLVHILGLGPFDFAEDEVKQLDTLVRAVETALPTGSTDQQESARCAIGQLQLRLGRLQKSIKALDLPVSHEDPWDRGYHLMAK